MLGRGLAVAAATVALDQVGKEWVLEHFGETGCGPHSERVNAFFDLVVTWNRGISFGLFNRSNEFGGVAFAIAAAAIVAVLIFWMSRVRGGFLAASIGLIVGGAIGNVIDRLRACHAVVDFLYFHVGSWYWPAFNLADSAICLGVAGMLLDGLRLRRAEPPAKGREDLLR